jgi:hypothetical protein
MFKQLFFAAVAASLLFACSSEPTAAQDTAEETAAPEETVKMQSFGEEISPDGALSYAEVQTKMSEASADSLAVKFTGTVQEVCQAKGCWMTIVSEEEGATPIMVKFKDYGFFMPKDIAGRKVIMEGMAFTEETPVDELRHYAEDAGKSQEEIDAITESKKETKFLASGVLLIEE